MAAIDALVSGVKDARATVLTGASLALVERTKEMLSRPGTGRLRRSQTDRKGRGSFVHTSFAETGQTKRMVRRGIPRTDISRADRASAPGEPPAPDLGTLRASIQYEPHDKDPYRVGTNVEYAAALEFGAPKIAPRPFMRPVLEIAKAEMKERVTMVLKTSVRSKGKKK